MREAAGADLDAVCAVLEDAFGRPDEARLFRALREGDDLALALVADGALPDEVGRTAGLVEAAGDAGLLASERESGTPVAADGAGSRLLGVAILSHLVAPKGCIGLGPLAVAGDCRDRGIGKALIAGCVEHARRARHGAIFVLGRPPWYTRHGFSVEAARPFRSEYPADYMMALELKPGALDGGGALIYPPVFAAL